MALPRTDTGDIKLLPTFDIRNGDLGAAVSLLTKPAIADKWRWVPIRNLPVEDALKHVDIFIRCARVGIMGDENDTSNNTVKHRMAVILGTARAVITQYYRITPEELIPGETTDPMITYNAPVAPDNVPTFTVIAGIGDAKTASINSQLELSKDDKDAMGDIILCAVGLPAVQGASLLNTGHHYLSDKASKSRPFYETIEKQFWLKDPLKSYLAGIEETARDLLWHKAGHPVNLTIKYRCAMDPAVAKKIAATSSGSSAARLPAEESNLKAAKTALTLFRNVRPFYRKYGGDLDYSLLSDAIMLASAYSPILPGTTENGESLPGMDAAAYRNPYTPNWVTGRNTALQYVDKLMEDNVDEIAIAFGFFEALSESAQMTGTTTGSQTLLAANSLTKLRNNASASYILGREYHGDYKAFKAGQRAAGKYKPARAVIALGGAPMAAE